MSVGGAGVFVGGTGVSVGGAGVFVGGTGVWVGGAEWGVSVGLAGRGPIHQNERGSLRKLMGCT